MQTTTRLHGYQAVAHGHNRRDPETVRKENEKRVHIDVNGEHEVWIDGDLQSTYDDLFGKALAEYNAKQKRKDRRMTMDEYMQSVEDDTRGKQATKKVKGEDGKTKRIADKKIKKGKKQSYELVVSAGNVVRKETDSQERTVYDATGHEIRQEELPPIMVREICKKYLDGFQPRNPHMQIVRCDWHADEGYYNHMGVWENGTPHIHLEYVPWADGFRRGLAVQNAMAKALEQQGYGGPDGLQKWQDAEREVLDRITMEVYADYCREHPDYYRTHGDLEIYHPIADREDDGDPAESLSPEAYQARIEAEQAMVREIVGLREEIRDLKESRASLDQAIADRAADAAEEMEQIRVDEMLSGYESAGQLALQWHEIEKDREKLNVQSRYEREQHERNQKSAQSIQTALAELDQREKQLDQRESDIEDRAVRLCAAHKADLDTDYDRRVKKRENELKTAYSAKMDGLDQREKDLEKERRYLMDMIRTLDSPDGRAGMMQAFLEKFPRKDKNGHVNGTMYDAFRIWQQQEARKGMAQGSYHTGRILQNAAGMDARARRDQAQSGMQI